jgi:hypothetical protein
LIHTVSKPLQPLLTVDDIAKHLELPAPRLVRQFIASGLLAAYELEPDVLRIRPRDMEGLCAAPSLVDSAEFMPSVAVRAASGIRARPWPVSHCSFRRPPPRTPQEIRGCTARCAHRLAPPFSSVQTFVALSRPNMEREPLIAREMRCDCGHSR